MKYKGIIFDFNGTLYWDSEKHKQAWREYSEKLRGYPFTDEEMLKYMFGRTNKEIISYALNKEADDELVKQLGDEKEALYRKRSLEDRKNFHLAKGSIALLDFLKGNNIPRTIATMSDKNNVDFYIEHFELKKWFDVEKIVYSNGKIASKPAPDIFQIAANNIGVEPKDCIVVEDAISGIESARRAGIGKIIAICSNESPSLYENIDCVSQIINDFDELDRNLFDVTVKI